VDQRAQSEPVDSAGIEPVRGLSVELVLFDVGSTLVDPHPSARDLILRVLQARGLTLEAEELARAEPLAFRAVSSLMPFQRYGQDESRAYWQAFYGALMRELGLPDDPVARDELYRTFQQLENWRLYDDALPVLETLRGRGYRLGVVSNWEEWLEDLLLSLEVHHFFELILASGPFGRAKPHPSIFERALALAGVPPQAAVHIGDRPLEDVDAPLSIGIRPILLDRRQRHGELAVERIASLTELLELLP
jgi:putative hydrolase of the HAD superfamily